MRHFPHVDNYRWQISVPARVGAHVSGKTYHQRYHFLFRVRDGKIAELREYFDTMHANDVLCSVPAPGFND